MNIMSSFVEMNKGRNPNFQFWWQFMHMVGVVLLFIKAQTDGIWDLRLYSFGHKICSHIFIDMIMPTIPGGEAYTVAYILHK